MMQKECTYLRHFSNFPHTALIRKGAPGKFDQICIQNSPPFLNGYSTGKPHYFPIR